jgi:hypothetical protein
VKKLFPLLTLPLPLVSEETQEVEEAGNAFMDIEETIVSTAQRMIELGLVKRNKAKGTCSSWWCLVGLEVLLFFLYLVNPSFFSLHQSELGVKAMKTKVRETGR